MISVGAGVERALRRFQPCLRAVERAERSVAKVWAPAMVRKLPEIFIFSAPGEAGAVLPVEDRRG